MSKKYFDLTGLAHFWDKLKDEFVSLTAEQEISGTKVFTGSLTASTQASTDNSTKVATTEFTQTAVNNKAPYVGTTAPTNTDLLWRDTSVSPTVLKQYNGSAWVEVGNIDEVYNVCSEGVTTPPAYYGSNGAFWCLRKAIIPKSVTNLPNYFLQTAPVTEVESYADGANITAGTYCLKDCLYLESVNLPTLITSSTSFLGTCSKLNNIHLPNLTTVGDECMMSCIALSSLSLPSLMTVSNSFCRSSTSLINVSLPSIASIGQYFLLSCPITSLTVGGANTLTLTSTAQNAYNSWKLPVADMVSFGTALKTAASSTAITFGATYWNALSVAQKAIFTGKNYTITTV